MSLGHGASIVRDGLVLHLDAANVKSYTGSGTTWSDMSGNGHNATLLNGPTYSPNDNGSISFDGANDYGEVTQKSSLLEFQPTDEFTLSVWFKTTTTPTTGAIISNMVVGSPYTGYDLWFNGGNQIASHHIASWNADAVKVKVDYNYSNFLNTWTHAAVTYDGSCPTTLSGMLNSMDFYFNGELNAAGKATGSVGVDGFTSASSTTSYSQTQRFRIASRWTSNSLDQGSSVVVSNVSVYSRKLDASEIKQNFEALRGRYGI